MIDKEPLGLYLHIPFCQRKCAYCDFYSSFVNDELLDVYTNRLVNAVKEWGGKLNRPISTIYFGGGTPSLLGSRIISVMDAVRNAFDVENNAEITLELNPSKQQDEVLSAAKAAGINRLSIGAQSGSDKELGILGRTHTSAETKNAVNVARKLGFTNVSLDLMIALPGSDKNTLESDLNFITGLQPEHISSYILKIEKNTAFYKNIDNLNLPDDDGQAEQYLYMCEYLSQKGYNHYEISNFCRNNYYSHHNLKYWNDEEYLGIGPSAHSFIDGKRFFYPRDLKAFLNHDEPVMDGFGGDKEEYIMLCLRLKSGLIYNEYRKKFGELPKEFFHVCKLLEKVGLINYSETFASLTDKGMVVSNSIITKVLECF